MGVRAPISAILFLTANPRSADQTLSARAELLDQIDVDRKWYFTLSAFYVYSGLTTDGKLSDQDRSATKATYWAELEPYRDTISADRATPEFLESVIANTETTTSRSLRHLFQEMDVDQDGMITPHEFLITEAAKI